MVFNSYAFLIFAICVFSVYFGVLPSEKFRTRKAFLLLASYLFYASYNPPFTLLLLGSTLLDFNIARRMDSISTPARRRLALLVSIVANLGLLGIFKYGNFFAENFYDLLSLCGSTLSNPHYDIFLPVGISFYTFQTLSYTIDVYRGRIEASDDLLDFALYVSFFPQLVAGPIVRAEDFIPQLRRQFQPTLSDLEYGLMRIVSGLVKKVVLADTLGAYVDVVFANPSGFHGLNSLIAIYAYAYQIYFDFSGYSDIAIGLGRVFGLRIPENFDRPYLATSPRDFWRRWHISLSTWLRDYLYISLGGNRGTALRTMTNLGITMLLGGLWHGAAWNFVIWGGYHGLLLAVQRLAEPLWPQAWAGQWTTARRVVTFHLVCLGWVFFRAGTTSDALALLGNLIEPGWVQWNGMNQALLMLGIAIAVHTAGSSSRLHEALLRQRPFMQGAIYAAATAVIFFFSTSTARFIYFQF